MISQAEFMRTFAKTREIASVSLPMTGELKTFIFANPEPLMGGWMACDGRALYVSRYPELFEALGYAFTAEDEFPDPNNPSEPSQRVAFRIPLIDSDQDQQGQIPIRHYIYTGSKQGLGSDGPRVQ
jgi:hypothetical protein